jgi:acylphosphatase
MFIHLNIKVFGCVQGVLFRQSAAYKAEELGITGFVRNDYDGSVYLEVEGKKEILDKFVAWCRRGPSFAKVTKIEVVESFLQKFSGFVIEG